MLLLLSLSPSGIVLCIAGCSPPFCPLHGSSYPVGRWRIEQLRLTIHPSTHAHSPILLVCSSIYRECYLGELLTRLSFQYGGFAVESTSRNSNQLTTAARTYTCDKVQQQQPNSGIYNDNVNNHNNNNDTTVTTTTAITKTTSTTAPTPTPTTNRTIRSR